MALDRILHGGLPCRSYEQACADIAAKRRPIAATIQIVNAYDPHEWSDEDHRNLLSLVRKRAPALARRPSVARTTLSGMYSLLGPTAGWFGYVGREKSVVWEAQQARINASTAAMFASVAGLAE